MHQYAGPAVTKGKLLAILQSFVVTARGLSCDEGVRWSVLVAGAAFLVASLFILLVPQPAIHVVDGHIYHAIAYPLAQDFRYGPAAYPYPLYPLFLALIYVLGGAYHAVFLVQGALLGLTAGLGYWLARQVAGHFAGLFAALLIMLDATLLGNVGLVATENLQAPLLLLAVILSLYAIERARVRYHIGAGVLWGLLTLAKPATLLWPPLLLPVYLIVQRRAGWRLWLMLVLAFGLTLSPWLARNQISSDATETGQFYLPFAQGYPTLLIHVVDEGEARHNMNHLKPKLQAVAAEAAEQGIKRDSIQFDLYTVRLLWERVARSPSAYLGHLWDNFSYFWLEPPTVWTDSVYNHLGNFPGGFRTVPGYFDHARLHAALALMGMLSLLLLYRQWPNSALFITVFALYYALFHTMFIVLPRFSAPIMPLVLIGSAVFPTLLCALIKEKLVNYRLLSNMLLATIAVALVVGMALQFYLKRPNYLQDGSFETERAEEVWFYEESAEDRDTSLLLDSNRARDGFRAAVLEITTDESGLETRIIQIVPVWFDATYRLKISYLFADEPAEGAPLFVDIREWSESEEVSTSIVGDALPVVSNTWMEREYEFKVSSSARSIAVIFGLRSKPSRVLLDDVRLELAVSVQDVIERPYLLEDPGKVNPNSYLPLEKWVETQPEGNRSFLRTNPGVARANGWRGDEGNLESVAYGVGIGVLMLWAVVGVLFVRLGMLQRIVKARLFDVGSLAAMVLIVTIQAATCYLLLFSNPI